MLAVSPEEGYTMRPKRCQQTNSARSEHDETLHPLYNYDVRYCEILFLTSNMIDLHSFQRVSLNWK